MNAHAAHLDDKGFIELVELAYKAAFEKSLWPAFLERFAEVLGGRNTALITHDVTSKRNDAVACARTDPEQLRLYNERYCDLNPWIHKGSAYLATGRVGVGEMHCQTDELVRTEFYNGWLRPQRLKHSIAAMIARSDTRIVVCSSLRGGAEGPFTSENITLYEATLSHLRAAFLTGERAAETFTAGREALQLVEDLPTPCVIVNRTARLFFVNRSARELLNRCRELRLKQGGLVALRPEDTKRLHELISRAAASPPATGQMAIFREHGQPLLVFVSPMLMHDTRLFPSRSSVVVWISDPNASAAPRTERIAALFRLTQAEASIASELARGLTLYEIADNLDISRHTVRNHLKSILQKTGSRRQGDVIRLILSCPDPFGS